MLCTCQYCVAVMSCFFFAGMHFSKSPLFFFQRNPWNTENVLPSFPVQSCSAVALSCLEVFSFFEAVPRALVYIYKIALFDAARHAAAGLLLGLSNSENASSASSSSSKDDKLYVLSRHVHGQSLPRRSGLVAKALGC